VSLLRYSVLVLALLGSTFAAVALLVRPDAPARAAAAYGAALATLNTLAAHALVSYAGGRSTRAFLGAVLGGMVGRLALMLAAVVAGIVALGLPRLPLAFALLAYFVMFLVVELAVQQRGVRRAADVR
jgi:hypothetical protein